jgi:hypothetical protein
LISMAGALLAQADKLQIRHRRRQTRDDGGDAAMAIAGSHGTRYSVVLPVPRRRCFRYERLPARVLRGKSAQVRNYTR